jgi:hypothetical protein
VVGNGLVGERARHAIGAAMGPGHDPDFTVAVQAQHILRVQATGHLEVVAHDVDGRRVLPFASNLLDDFFHLAYRHRQGFGTEGSSEGLGVRAAREKRHPRGGLLAHRRGNLESQLEGLRSAGRWNKRVGIAPVIVELATRHGLGNDLAVVILDVPDFTRCADIHQ